MIDTELKPNKILQDSFAMAVEIGAAVIVEEKFLVWLSSNHFVQHEDIDGDVYIDDFGEEYNLEDRTCRRATMAMVLVRRLRMKTCYG